MDLRFVWAEYNGRYCPGIQCADEGERANYLRNLLIDDGGLGFDLHLPWLKEARAMCERVNDGSPHECFTTELFAADISREGVWISEITADPADGVRFSLLGFVGVLDDWIPYLERGYNVQKPSEVFHSNYSE
jgi:hypothetical protein